MNNVQIEKPPFDWGGFLVVLSKDRIDFYNPSTTYGGFPSPYTGAALKGEIPTPYK